MVINDERLFVKEVKRLYLDKFLKLNLRRSFLNYLYDYINKEAKDFNKYFTLSISDVSKFYNVNRNRYSKAFIADDYKTVNVYYTNSKVKTDYIISFNYKDGKYVKNKDIKLLNIIDNLYRIVLVDMVKYAYEHIKDDIRHIFQSDNVKFDKTYNLIEINKWFMFDFPKEGLYMPFITFNLRNLIDCRDGSLITYKNKSNNKLTYNEYIESSLYYNIFNNKLTKRYDVNNLYEHTSFDLLHPIRESEFKLEFSNKNRIIKESVNNTYNPTKLKDLLPDYTLPESFIIGNIFNNLCITNEYENGNKFFIMFNVLGNSTSFIGNRTSIPAYKSIRFRDSVKRKISREINTNNEFKDITFSSIKKLITDSINYYNVTFYNKLVSDINNTVNNNSYGISLSLHEFNNLNVDHISESHPSISTAANNLYEDLLKSNNLKALDNNKIFNLMMHMFNASSYSYFGSNAKIDDRVYFYIDCDVKDSDMVNRINNGAQNYSSRPFDSFSFDIKYKYSGAKNLYSQIKRYIDFKDDLVISNISNSDECIEEFINSIVHVFNKHYPIYENQGLIAVVNPLLTEVRMNLRKQLRYNNQLKKEENDLFNSSVKVIGKVHNISDVLTAIAFIDAENVTFKVINIC